MLETVYFMSNYISVLFYSVSVQVKALAVHIPGFSVTYLATMMINQM